MREILFRGKQKDTGKWVYGYFYEECGDTFIIENRQTKMPYRNIPYKVDPETVEQYTGLTDKNGVKIFEGDIVLFHGILSNDLGEIKYNKYKSRYHIAYNNFKAAFCVYCNNGYYRVDNQMIIEVIGNIPRP